MPFLPSPDAGYKEFVFIAGAKIHKTNSASVAAKKCTKRDVKIVQQIFGAFKTFNFWTQVFYNFKKFRIFETSKLSSKFKTKL